MSFLVELKRSRLVHLCIAITYFTSGLAINIVQCILFYTLKPLNKKLYRHIGYYLCYSFYSQLVFIHDWWSNSKVYVYMDPDDFKNFVGKEHVLLIMNHAYEIDWLVGWVFCEKCGVLGNCKAYAKKAIQYIPTVGWAWKFAEFVFLERSYDKDKEIIKRQLNEIYDYPDPAWLLLNAEGTRFTESKHEASIKFAQDRGWPVLKHHLIPRTKGFTASLPVLKEKCPAIYDIQLAFHKDDENSPTISNLLFGESVTSHLMVRRIPIKPLPEDEIEGAEWLQDLFRQKDKMQDSFHKHGDFFHDTGVKPVQGVLQKPSMSCLINMIVWSFVTLAPIMFYLTKLLFSGELVYFSIGAGILTAFYVLMQKSIGMSKISKGSSYGADGKLKPE